MASSELKSGNSYTRADVAELVGLPPEKRKGGNWSTGATRFNGEWFIFTNVGSAGRTGHNYGNKWVGEDLEWRGRTDSTVHHPTIQSMQELPVHIFTREQDREKFVYRGIGIPARIDATVPVTILWRFSLASDAGDLAPAELKDHKKYAEGARKQIWVDAIERDRGARIACIRKWGTKCAVCGFEFGKVYGTLGDGFIEVHHLTPLAAAGEEILIDPIADLRPVCSNCHSMLHRRNPILSIDDLKNVMASAPGS